MLSNTCGLAEEITRQMKRKPTKGRRKRNQEGEYGRQECEPEKGKTLMERRRNEA